MSEIITDKITGRGVAKTITVTVGATATQSLEQGLVKAWGHSNHSANTIQDSFNITSITDDGTGLKDYNWTSSFSSANYVGANGMGGNEGATTNMRASSVNGVWTSSQAIIKFSQSSSSGADDVNALAMFIGESA